MAGRSQNWKPRPNGAEKLFDLPPKERVAYLINIIWQMQGQIDELKYENQAMRYRSFQSFIDEAYADGVEAGQIRILNRE